MLFILIDKIKKYVNNSSDDAHLMAIICGAIAWITYCNYKDKKIADTSGGAMWRYKNKNKNKNNYKLN